MDGVVLPLSPTPPPTPTLPTLLFEINLVLNWCQESHFQKLHRRRWRRRQRGKASTGTYRK